MGDSVLPVLVVVGVVLVLGAGVWLWLRSRKPREEAFHHFRCPGCHRRLRYRDRQVGHRGQCSRCGRALTFPPVAEADD